MFRYKDWISCLQDEFRGLTDIIPREKILEGNIMHVLLSRINNCLNQDQDAIIAEACAFAEDAFPGVSDFSKYRSKLAAVLLKNELKRFFYVKEGDVFCEKEVVNNFGDLKRIDRLIISEKNIYIIDYKSSQEAEEQHVKQISEYIEIFRNIYPKRAIKGFLIYLDTLGVKEL